MNKEKNKIGLSKSSLSDLPDDQSMINSLSLRNLLRLNRIARNMHIGKVNRIILGNKRSTYEI